MMPMLRPIAHTLIVRASESSSIVLRLFGFIKPKESVPIAFRQGVYWALENAHDLLAPTHRGGALGSVDGKTTQYLQGDLAVIRLNNGDKK